MDFISFVRNPFGRDKLDPELRRDCGEIGKYSPIDGLLEVIGEGVVLAVVCIKCSREASS
jgi:hypothetical protein